MIAHLLLSALFSTGTLSPSAPNPPGSYTQAPAPVRLEGRWTGMMSLGDNQYPINLWFDAGERSGRFQMIGMSTDRNPIENVVRQGETISFTLPANPLHTFRGTLRGQRLTGTVRVGSSNNSFSVQRVSRP